MHNKHGSNSNRCNSSICKLYFFLTQFLKFYLLGYLYVQKKKKIYFFWTVTHESSGRRDLKKKKPNRKVFKLTKEKIKKKPTRVIACYCWKEDGHLFQSLLFGFFFFSLLLFLCFFLLGLCHFYGQLYSR